MKNWKTVAVPPHTALEAAIAALDKGGLGIVIVTDADDVLLGTVTDGDVRRALLRRVQALLGSPTRHRQLPV